MTKKPKTAAAKAKKSPKALAYSKPSEVGGRLIRTVVGFLKQSGIALPLSDSNNASHILIAVSGGMDSIALATLVIKYGRRVMPRERIELLHINHGWRGAESDGDEAFVREFARKFQVELHVRRLQAPSQKGESWEDLARRERKKIFEEFAAKREARILTAHHADDLAETMLWRLFTGAAETHGGGISVEHGVEIRPLLNIRKEMLRSFLKEEDQEWREDSTNHEKRFLRARMRQELLPIIERLFPKAIEHLVKLGLAAQGKGRLSTTASVRNGEDRGALEALFAMEKIRMRRSQWEWIQSNSDGEIHLSAGWRLIRERDGSWRLKRPDQNDKPLE